MPETVSINREMGTIEVRATGNVDGTDIANSLRQIAELGKETGIKAVLVDVTEQVGQPSVADMYRLMSTLPPDMKFALFSTAPQGMLSTHTFGELVATNRSLQFALFDDRDKALSWLHPDKED